LLHRQRPTKRSHQMLAMYFERPRFFSNTYSPSLDATLSVSIKRCIATISWIAVSMRASGCCICRLLSTLATHGCVDSGRNLELLQCRMVVGLCYLVRKGAFWSRRGLTVGLYKSRDERTRSGHGRSGAVLFQEYKTLNWPVTLSTLCASPYDAEDGC
jgi:hypothetical protein